MTQDNKQTSHWAHQLYFYVVIAFSVLFFSMGSFIFLRANLVNFVFTKVDIGYVYIEGCDTSGKPTPVYTYNSEGKDSQKTLYTEEECEEKLKEEKQVQYQEDLLTSILMTSISALVFGIHFKFVRPTK